MAQCRLEAVRNAFSQGKALNLSGSHAVVTAGVQLQHVASPCGEGPSLRGDPGILR